MDAIAVVKRRNRVWPVVLMLLVLAVVVLAVLWTMGYFGTSEVDLTVLAAPAPTAVAGIP